VQLGTTAFSFTNEWLTGTVTLDRLLGRVAELGLGPGLELIGFQAWRSFPSLTRDEILGFRRQVDELGLEPAALGAYADVARRADRPMTSDEAVAFLRPQLDVAEKLGFPLLRLHAGISDEALEALAPLAEKTGITLATELQGGQSPDGEPAAGLLRLRERLDTPAIAIALDFSVAMTAVPAPFVDAVLAAGMAREDIDSVVELWESGASTPELFGALAALDAPSRAMLEAQSGFVRFGRQEPEEWTGVVPAIAYAHAKFWLPDEAGEEPTVRTAELLDVLSRGGFEGVVATEWGGNAWLDAPNTDAFSLVQRHGAFCRAQLFEPALEVPARP
jgi:hypothetical protein